MNFESELENALRELDVSELDGLIRDIELPCNRKAGKSIAEKSVRKERITMSKSIKKRTAAGIVAAVAALGCTVAAGAYVYDYFAHQKQNVTELTGDSQYAEELESKGLLDNEEVKFDHFIISKDTKVIFDGAIARCMVSIIPIDEEGNELTSDITGRFSATPDIADVYDENGANIFIGSSEYPNYSNDYFGLDITLHLSKPYDSQTANIMINDIKTHETYSKLEYKLEKNIDAYTFKSDDGKRIIFSELGLSAMDNYSLMAKLNNEPSKVKLDDVLFTLILKDGTSIDIKYSDVRGGPDLDKPYSKDYFKSSIEMLTKKYDAENVTAIIIDGERFEPAQE